MAAARCVLVGGAMSAVEREKTPGCVERVLPVKSKQSLEMSLEDKRGERAMVGQSVFSKVRFVAFSRVGCNS